MTAYSSSNFSFLERSGCGFGHDFGRLRGFVHLCPDSTHNHTQNGRSQDNKRLVKEVVGGRLPHEYGDDTWIRGALVHTKVLLVYKPDDIS